MGSGVKREIGRDLSSTPPTGLRVAELHSDGQIFLVFSHPTTDLPVPECLASGEADVVRRILRGQSSEEIARARGTALRTVANQLASIYRKLGVRGRLELASMLARS